MTTHTDPAQASSPVNLVIGGTGKTGRRVVDRLTAAGHTTRSVSRHSDPAFDWDDRDTWGSSLHGVAAAYITFSPDLAFPGASDTIADFAAEAVAAGVRRLVLLSGRGEEGALASEQAVRESGASWTIVRCSWFNQNFSEAFFLDSVLEGEIVVPAGDSVEPFVDAEDIADVVMAALTEPGHDGQVYELTGPRLLSFDDIAVELSTSTGRKISYVRVSHQEYAAILADFGLPAEFGELFSNVLDGRNAHLTNGVQRALGRAPRDFSSYAAETAASGVWNSLQPVR